MNPAKPRLLPRGPVAPRQLDAALDHLRAGGRLFTVTHQMGGRITVLDGRVLKRFEKAGAWLLKCDGDGYRVRRGRGSDYCYPGILCAE